MSCIQKNCFAENPSSVKWVKADHSSWLWMVNAGYGWSMLVTDGQCWLQMVNAGYGWSMLVTDGQCWLWMFKVNMVLNIHRNHKAY